MPHLRNDEPNLIKLQSLLFFAYSLGSIFTNIFIFKLSDFQTALLYRLMVLIFLLVGFVFSGWLIQKITASLLVRIGIGILAASSFFLFVLREQAVGWVTWLGMLEGLGAGFFWAGFNVSQYLATRADSRVAYFGKAGAWIGLVQALGPLLGGLIITFGAQVTGTVIVGYAVLFLSVALILFTGALTAGRLPNVSHFEFSFRKLWDHPRDRQWRFVLGQQAVLGAYDFTFTTMTGILFFVILKGELTTGTISTVGSLIAMGGYWLAARFLRRRQRWYWLGVAGSSIGILFFALNQNLLGILGLLLFASFLSPWLNIWLSTVYFNTLDEQLVHHRQKFPYLLERDLALGIPRILSLLLLLGFVSWGDQVTLARQFLYLLPVFPVIIGLLLWQQEKQKMLPIISNRKQHL